MSGAYCPCCERPYEKAAVTERDGIRLSQGKLTYRGQSVYLIPRLAMLAEAILDSRAGYASIDYLLMRCWPDGVKENVVVAVCHLRRAIEGILGIEIQNRPKVGYRFEVVR